MLGGEKQDKLVVDFRKNGRRRSFDDDSRSQISHGYLEEYSLSNSYSWGQPADRGTVGQQVKVPRSHPAVKHLYSPKVVEPQVWSKHEDREQIASSLNVHFLMDWVSCNSILRRCCNPLRVKEMDACESEPSRLFYRISEWKGIRFRKPKMFVPNEGLRRILMCG